MVKTAKLVITKLVIIRLHHRQMAKIRPQLAAAPQPTPSQPMTTLRPRPKLAAVAVLDAVLPRLIEPQQKMPQKIVPIVIMKRRLQRQNLPAMVR